MPLWVVLLVERLGNVLPSLIQFRLKHVDNLDVRNSFRYFIPGLYFRVIQGFHLDFPLHFLEYLIQTGSRAFESHGCEA